MTKRSHQAASRYAGRSGQAKKKRPSKSPGEARLVPDSHAPVLTSVQSPASQARKAVQPGQVTNPGLKTGGRLRVPEVAATYAYIASDLMRTGIIAVVIFALLIVLAAIFG